LMGFEGPRGTEVWGNASATASLRTFEDDSVGAPDGNRRSLRMLRGSLALGGRRRKSQVVPQARGLLSSFHFRAAALYPSSACRRPGVSPGGSDTNGPLRSWGRYVLCGVEPDEVNRRWATTLNRQGSPGRWVCSIDSNEWFLKHTLCGKRGTWRRMVLRRTISFVRGAGRNVFRRQLRGTCRPF